MARSRAAKSFRIPSPARRAPSLWVLVGTALLVGMGGFPSPGSSQGQGRDLLVSPDWLAQHLDDPGLVLLHVGAEEAYGAEHIPGARYVNHRAFAAPEEEGSGATLNLELPDPQTLVATLEGMGIGDSSRVVVYFGEDWVTPTTRVLFTLDWIGLGNRTLLLDGGMPAWKAAGHPVTAEVPSSPAPGHLTAAPVSRKVASAEWIRDHLDDENVAIVDARSPEYFHGTRATNLRGEAVRAGHIPGAGNLYATELVGDDLRLKSPEELRVLFTEAGVEAGDTVVVYCHLGQYATLVALGARVLGHPAVVYDGSFQEWGSREDLPVTGPGGGFLR